MGGERIKILFCTVGTTPQIVTETVWELMRQDPSWVPDRIHIVTTTFKLGFIRENLQTREGPLGQLMQCVPPVTIHVPRHDSDEDYFVGPGEILAQPGDLLDDVHNQNEAARMGNLILRVLARITSDPATQLHMSLAGGRKTMSAHALMALSLVGRAIDTTSHVLVTPTEYESHPDFWYPGQVAKIRAKDGAELDPAKASVTLVPTPVPLMRNRVVKAEELGKLDLLELTRKANLAAALEQDPQVTLHINDNSIFAHGVTIGLSPKHFAVYRLLATARMENWAGAGPEGIGDGHAGWLTLWQIAFGKTGNGRDIANLMLEYIRAGELVAMQDTQDSKSSSKTWELDVITKSDSIKLDKVAGNINPDVVRIQNAIIRKVGGDAASTLAPQRGKKSEARFGLAIPPHAIEIV